MSRKKAKAPERKPLSRVTQLEIEALMRVGKLYDQFADKAIKQGRIEAATTWGNKAIRAYTKAEELSLG